MALQEDICAICRVSMNSENSATYCIPECGHRFHSNCVIQWFRVSNGSCPYCRAACINAPVRARRRYGTVPVELTKLWKQLARRKDCPLLVKRKCQRVAKAKAAKEAASKKLTQFRRVHREKFKKWSVLRRKKYSTITRWKKLEHELASLPPLPIMRYLQPRTPSTS